MASSRPGGVEELPVLCPPREKEEQEQPPVRRLKEAEPPVGSVPQEREQSRQQGAVSGQAGWAPSPS